MGQQDGEDEKLDIKLAGLNEDDIKKMYPSLRFSSEVSTMIKILFRVLNQINSRDEYLTKDEKAEMISSNILGIVFVP